MYLLAGSLRERLNATPGVRVHDLGAERCGIVTFTVAGVEAEAVRERLRRQRVNISVSSRGSTRLDMEARGLSTLARASVHYYNTEEEVDRFVRAVASLR